MTTTTIVIPTRERVPLLRTTLHTVLASATEAERFGFSTRVLVVDDASPTTATEQLCRELGVDYARIDEHDGQNDPASAICLGVSLVTTEFYSLFGDDDIMLPRFVRLHLERLAEGYDLCSGSYRMVDADLGSPVDKVLPPPHAGDLLAGRIMVNDGAMVRTELAQPLPWDPRLRQVVLYPVWLRILASDARTTTLAEPTWLYRRHDRNISSRLSDDDAATRARVQEEFRAEWTARGLPLPEPSARTATPPRPEPVAAPAAAPAPGPPAPPARPSVRAPDDVPAPAPVPAVAVRARRRLARALARRRRAKQA